MKRIPTVLLPIPVSVFLLIALARATPPDEIPPPAPTAPWASSPGTVSLLTYNIWGLYPIAGGKARWRYEEIGSRLESFDIVALQEAWDTVTERLPQKAQFPFEARGRRAHQLIGGSGLITLSRYPILETETLTYKNCIGADCLADKGALRTRILLPDSTQIDVYNTHLNAWFKAGADFGAKVRRRQIEQLAKWIEERSTTLPALILGDTNSPDDSVNYEQMLIAFRGIDIYRLLNPTSPTKDGFTYDPGENGWIPDIPEFLVKPMRIDYIWLKNCKNPSAYRSQLEFTESVRNGKPLSDHFGVSAEINLAPCLALP